MGSKTPGPPEVTEREKSPVTVTEKEKVPRSQALTTIRHALPEERSVIGVSSEVTEMETSSASAPTSATAGKHAQLGAGNSPAA